ncbi:MAG: twitch domain-containing radical SAM protein [Candidatus Promineifilaceae bacterium]|nr:twitch domain-containing radical SAM protein [Candidatus Promineifilaceae bacterium]
MNEIQDPSESFCVLPWMHIFADERGIIFPCCRINNKFPNVDDETGRPHQIQDENALENAWNSNYMRTLRLDMLNGLRPEACARCYMYDDLGMRSQRQIDNDHHRARIPALIAQTKADGWAPLDLRTVDLRLGNLCNLRCRMCSPQASKALIGEWASFYDVSPHHPNLENFWHQEWFADENFWQIFEKHTANIERLHFAGGEPLLIPQMFDFLERLIELGRASKIFVSYNTNLTILPERILDLWPHFRKVRVTVSLDGFDQVNAYIRHPAHWPTLDRHLHILDAQADQLNLKGGVGINTTVQVYNIFRLDEHIKYLATSFQRIEAPNLTILSYPEHFNIRLLPPQMKASAAERLRYFTDTFAGSWPDHWQGASLIKLHKAIDGIVEHMDGESTEDALLQFRRWSEHFDQTRGQHVLDVIPELAPLFEGVHEGA